jgi:protein-S-isoprenylcysteine O-methyltransferase Ste14
MENAKKNIGSRFIWFREVFKKCFMLEGIYWRARIHMATGSNITNLKRRFVTLAASVLATLHTVPSLTVILNPLLYIMFFPVGVYALLTWPWPLLKDIPDPFSPGQSLYWLTYVYSIHSENPLLPSIFRWGVVDAAFVSGGAVLFILASATWLRYRGGVIKTGVYRHVRHPQYLGLILTALGLSIRASRPVSLLAWLTLVFSYIALASYEEAELIKSRGESYLSYMGETPFIMPFIKARLPQLLSPERPYRYLLITAMYVISSLAVIAVSRHIITSFRVNILKVF